MTKERLMELLESVPDDYEVLIDTKKLMTYFVDHENEQINLSSDNFLQFAHVYNPLVPLTQLVFAHTNRQMNI